jgi:hypothetical protein
MDTDSLSSGQFGGMDNSMGSGSSGSDTSGLNGPTGSSGVPSTMGAGSGTTSSMYSGT